MIIVADMADIKEAVERLVPGITNWGMRDNGDGSCTINWPDPKNPPITQAAIEADIPKVQANRPIKAQIAQLEASISTPRRMREFMLGLSAKQGSGNPNANQAATMTEIESVAAQIDSLRATLQ